jgi:hypothetical protein
MQPVLARIKETDEVVSRRTSDGKRHHRPLSLSSQSADDESGGVDQIRRTEEELIEMGTEEYALLHIISRETLLGTSGPLTRDKTGSTTMTILFFT